MYQCNTTQFACLYNARRKHPQTPRVSSLFSIFLSSFLHPFRNKKITTYPIYLQGTYPFDVLYRAKRYFQLGLLALFFCRFTCNTIYRRGQTIYA